MALRGRNALVTGASSGIGLAVSKLFAKNECSVLSLTGRNEEALRAVKEDIEKAGNGTTKVQYFVGDVTKDHDVERIVKSSCETSKLDILVNCAGVLQGGSVDAATMENFDFNFNVNTRAVFSFMRQAIPFMERSKDGSSLTASIVNVTSVNGLQSFGGVAAYCASKAATDMLTDCAAVDLAPKHIRCNAVNPGVTISELQKRGGLSNDQYEAFLERSKVTHPLGRVAEAEEVAEAILFLADSSKSDFITGTHLTVDGGRKCLGAR